MSKRWVRFLLAMLAFAAVGAAAYRVLQDEQALTEHAAAKRTAQYAGESALLAVEELRSAFHAYVAPRQGQLFWAARAKSLFDKLHSSLLELDAVASGHGMSVAGALDTSDRLAEADERARDHIRSGESLLASEVIFNDARELLDALRTEIANGRGRIDAAAATREAALRREQMLFIAGAAGIVGLVMLVLATTGSARSEQQEVSDDSPAMGGQVAADRTEPPWAIVSEHPLSSAALDSDLDISGVFGSDAGANRSRSTLRAPVTSDMAALCTDLAVVRDGREIDGLLDRAARLLDATGVIVWMSGPDRQELHSVAASGYDDRLLARLGPIRTDTDTLTAAAFRDNVPRTNTGSGLSAAGMAVPLPAPGGPVGVFSAELTPGVVIDNAKLDEARVIAAQLGALVGSIPANEAAEAVPRAVSGA